MTRLSMRLRLALAFGVVVVLLLGAAAVQAEEATKNVILIGWDGAQRDHVNEMLARHELPTLAALAKDGTMVDIDVVTGATDTKAGWTQILTGYRPRTTGVFNNARFRPIPIGYTIFERVEEHFGPENVETRAIVGKKGHVDADPPTRIPYEKWLKRQARQQKIDQQKPGLGNIPGGRVVEENGVKYVVAPGKPYFHTKDHMDMFVNGLLENEKVGTMALENLEQCKDKRFLFFVHFAEPDHSGHAHGENSQEYSDALKLDDEWTGKIIAKLKELGLYDKTLVYVVVDHGFNEGTKGHSYAPYVFLATNDKKVNRAGVREDIAPTVLKRFGLDLSKIAPPLDGIPLDEPAPVRKAPAKKPAPRVRQLR
jgi:hypothetical protein